MESEIIHYLILVSKLRDIVQYIDNHFQENDIKSYILECKNLCLEKLKKEHLITTFMEEVSSQKQEETTQTEQIQPIEQNDQTVSSQEDSNDVSQTISVISNLLGGPQEMSIKDFDPSSFDSLGNGLARLLRINPQPTPTVSIQQPIDLIKNEIKNANNNNNLTYQIKKKI